jgi:hypothetical protein
MLATLLKVFLIDRLRSQMTPRSRTLYAQTMTSFPTCSDRSVLNIFIAKSDNFSFHRDQLQLTARSCECQCCLSWWYACDPPVRYELNQIKAGPLTPKRWVVSMLNCASWSTKSKAELRSRRTKPQTSPESTASMTESCPATKVVFVEWLPFIGWALDGGNECAWWIWRRRRTPRSSTRSKFDIG